MAPRAPNVESQLNENALASGRPDLGIRDERHHVLLVARVYRPPTARGVVVSFGQDWLPVGLEPVMVGQQPLPCSE